MSEDVKTYTDGDGYRVRLERWHSDCLNEDFCGVSIYRPDGSEAMHSGMGNPELFERDPAEVLSRQRTLVRMLANFGK